MISFNTVSSYSVKYPKCYKVKYIFEIGYLGFLLFGSLKRV